MECWVEDVTHVIYHGYSLTPQPLPSNTITLTLQQHNRYSPFRALQVAFHFHAVDLVLNRASSLRMCDDSVMTVR
jgi:hypothetical protein